VAIFEPATQSAGVNIVTRSSVSSELLECFISNICSIYTYLYMVHNICKGTLGSAAFLLGIDEKNGSGCYNEVIAIYAGAYKSKVHR
jgi:hypothetical protein